MKYLKYFETESVYDSYKNGSDYILPNVSYVVETKGVSYEPYVPVPVPAGGIVYFTEGKLKSIHYNEWDNSLGTPVGVITIPAGFAPDGKARMVALSGQTGITWGGHGTETSLTNYNGVPTTDNAGSTSTGSNSLGFLPSDNFTGAASYVDSVAKYSYSQTDGLIPSPYAGDAPNPEYYKEINGYNNALSDFNGLENTQTLVELDSANYQAANHCWTYDDGVSTTQWYLPACGELGYIIPRFNEIQTGLAKVNAVQLDSSYFYWSSSEYSSTRACNVYTSLGTVTYNLKTSGYYARPWAIIE